MQYFHGSYDEFEKGKELSGRGEEYVEDWIHTDFYQILERYRPAVCLAHQKAVFMVSDPDDIDLVGGATDWCSEVVPENPVSRHDVNWSTEISCLLSDGHNQESKPVMDAALHYWNGVAHKSGAVWEYIAPACTVVRCEPFEDFEVKPTATPKIKAR
jgi:hypothetical protein